MVVAGELIHALNDDGAVIVNENNGAHLLQYGDEINDFGLNRGVLQYGFALCAHCGEEHLLGGTH